MKPILFNTQMVRAIRDGHKTVTRRAVKPQPSVECRHSGQHEFIRDDFIDGCNFTGFVCRKCGYGVCGPHFKFPVGSSWIRPPYRPGDILYVRETWLTMPTFHTDGRPTVEYLYKADMTHQEEYSWRPSIHMPREAARIFLRVTDVKVERLQDITEEQSISEGCSGVFAGSGETLGSGWEVTPTDEFSKLWDSTIKPVDRALYGWEANPWVWVIEFEKTSREGGNET